MGKLVVGWIALGVGLAAPISVYAQDATTAQVTHHRTVHKVKIVHTVQVEHTATVEPVVYTVSHGRGAATEDVFSRNPEDCSQRLCIGQ
jgi:hypothetical protein